MNLDDRAIQREGLDFDAHDLSCLQLLEDGLQYALLRPAAEPRINRVPISESLWQATPFAAVLSDVENGVEHLQIREAHISALPRQAMFDLRILSRSNLHNSIIQHQLRCVN